jgi:hypothetical protein
MISLDLKEGITSEINSSIGICPSVPGWIVNCRQLFCKALDAGQERRQGKE